MQENKQIIYCVIQNDHHFDVDVRLFLTPDKAIAYAQNILDENSDRAKYVNPDDARMTDEELAKAEWLFYGCYSVEGDCVWVYPAEIIR